jgi:membrane complex biogenesis BtpA family protein
MPDASALFPRAGTLVGMVHLAALPGTPASALAPREVVARAVGEARLLHEAGFEALLVENMGDLPYLAREVGPEVTAVMTAACLAVRAAVPDLPLGVQVLAGANEAALAVAHAAGADFVRVEGFAFASVADEGLLAEASAGPLLRYRRAIGAERVAVVADVRKKHSAHALTGDLDLADLARGAEFCGADALVVTGRHTGHPTSVEDLRAVAGATSLPVLVGSGTTPENAAAVVPHASGLIVGSALKAGGDWRGALDPGRCEALVAAVRAARA